MCCKHQVFTRSECQVHPDDKSLYSKIYNAGKSNSVGVHATHTGMCTVTACRTFKKCEKEATFLWQKML